jgi:hypothetical protein
VKDLLEMIRPLLEIPARYFFAAAVVAGGLLALAASRAAAVFGLENAPPYARFWLTVVMLTSISIGAVKIATARRDHRKAAGRNAARARAITDNIESLNNRERTVLYWHVARGERSGYADVMHPVVLGLRQRGLAVMREGFGDTARYPEIPAAVFEQLQDYFGQADIPDEVRTRVTTMSATTMLDSVDPYWSR